MLSNSERNELANMVKSAQACLANDRLTPTEAHAFREHGETLVELERMRRFPAYAPALMGCGV